MTTAKEAHEIASGLMTAMGKKALNHVGEWNTLMLYLESKMREEAPQPSPGA